MRFRPCIDIHNGKVKQIVGTSLRDGSDHAADNFVSDLDAAWYAEKYAADGLTGGHIILLNPADSPYYEEDTAQALRALRAAPGALQIGGGITPENAQRCLDAGASHVIVTSYVFREGRIDEARLERMRAAVGRERLVLDLSCRLREGPEEQSGYYIVTDRWQRWTQVKLSLETLRRLRDSCDEFLIHAADVEGKQAGPDRRLAELLGTFAWEAAQQNAGGQEKESAGRRPGADAGDGIITYAGGIRSFADLKLLRQAGKDRVDATIGSALDLFGGSLEYRAVLSYLAGKIV